MLSAETREGLAERLWRAERDRAPISPLVESHPDIDVVDAYEIQLINIRRRDIAVAGHKVGLSSPAMQQMMGVDEPDYGHLLADMRLAEDVPIDARAYCYPRVEVEVGFLLAEDIPPDCDEQGVLERTEALIPSIELIDSRIRDWRIGIADTIADNASSGGVVLGDARAKPGELDLADIEAVLLADGSEIARGNTAAVLGDPTTAVAWLARKVAAFGIRLEAGHLILPGSCTRAVDVAPGAEYRADYTGLGSVTARFT